VLLINTGELKTHGEPLGEKKVSLDSPEETLVVSATWPHIQTNDYLYFGLSSFTNILNVFINSNQYLFILSNFT
jgi:hypothetical protein